LSVCRRSSTYRIWSPLLARHPHGVMSAAVGVHGVPPGRSSGKKDHPLRNIRHSRAPQRMTQATTGRRHALRRPPAGPAHRHRHSADRQPAAPANTSTPRGGWISPSARSWPTRSPPPQSPVRSCTGTPTHKTAEARAGRIGGGGVSFPADPRIAAALLGGPERDLDLDGDPGCREAEHVVRAVVAGNR
jgi:hypothetical protein